MKKRWMMLVLGGLVAVGIAALAQNREPVTITFAHWEAEDGRKALENMVAMFEKANPDIKVKLQQYPGGDEYATKMNTLVAANQAPDVAYMNEGMALRLGEQGQLLEVSKYYNEFPELKNRLPQLQLYFAPGRSVGSTTAAESIQLFYNRKLFKDAGLEPPPADAAKAWTWAQFVNVAKRLTIDANGRNATQAGFDPDRIRQYGVLAPTWWALWYPLVRSNNGELTTAGGTRYALNSPQSVEVLQRIQDLIYKDRVAPTPAQQQTLGSGVNLMASGRLAMSIGGQWDVLFMNEAKVDFSVAVLPKFRVARTMLLGGATVIFASTKNVKEALRFYAYHNNPEAVDLFAKGLWMPLETKYYTEQKYIDLWTKNGAHPPEYRTAVIDYVMKNAISAPSLRLKNWPAIDSRLGAGLDDVWLNKKTAKQAADDLAAVIQPLLQGAYPDK